MKKERKVPELRFNGFADDWNHKKLKHLTTKIKSYSLSRKVETSNGTGYRYVHYGDIHTGRARVINNEATLPKIEKGKYDTLQKGDLIIADASEDYNGIAWPSILNTIPHDNIVAGLHTIALRPTDQAIPMFLYIQFLTNNFRKYGYKMGTGMKVFGITYDNLVNYQFYLPTLAEQNKIFNMLQCIDNIITLEQQKLRHYQVIQNLLFETLFSSNRIPLLRFNGFTDDWHQHSLSDISVINPKSQLPNKFKYVDLESVSRTSLVSYRTEYKEKAPSRAQRVAEKGDIFYQVVRPYQKNNYFFNLDLNDYVFSTGYAQIRPKLNNYFIFYYLQSDHFVSKVLKMCTGTSYPAINSKNLSKIKLSMPNNQEEVSNIEFSFNKLDNIMSQQHKIIEKYILLKNNLLQKLFI